MFTLLVNLKLYYSCDLIKNFRWFLDPRNREVVEIARRPIFQRGGSSVYISMKNYFDLQLKIGSPLPRHSEAVSSSTDEAFKKRL